MLPFGVHMLFASLQNLNDLQKGLGSPFRPHTRGRRRLLCSAGSGLGAAWAPGSGPRAEATLESLQGSPNGWFPAYPLGGLL